MKPDRGDLVRSNILSFFARAFLCLVSSLLVSALLLPFPAAVGGSVKAQTTTPDQGTVSSLALRDRVGVVSSHIKNYPPDVIEKELDAVRDGGFGWIRCDFAWYDLEPQKGNWNFQGTDRVVELAGSRGVKVLGILGSCPPWANGGNSWNYPPTDLEAWKNYVSTVVSRYRGRVAAWEIWNEENIHAFWQPEPNPAAYVGLLALASAEIRKADPDAIVVMGGVAGLDPDYLNACLALGAAEHVDAIAYHPYAETIGEEGQPQADFLRPKERLCRNIVGFVRNLISLYTQRKVEIWITEVGWTTWEGETGVDEVTQADYLARTILNYASTEVSKVFVYNLRDTHLNDVDRYGLLRVDFSAKEASRVMGNLLREAADAESLDPMPFQVQCTGPGSLEAHAFRVRGGDLLLSLWKSDDAPDTGFLRFEGASSFRNPVLLDPVSGARIPLEGIARDPSSGLSVGNLGLGKRPLLILFSEVELWSVYPSRGQQFTIILDLESVKGRGFASGAKLELVRGGSRLGCYDVQLISEGELRCRVGLWGAEPGRYDLVLVNPDGSGAVLPSAFEVVPLCGVGAGVMFLLGTPVLAVLWLAGRRKSSFLPRVKSGRGAIGRIR